MLDLTSEACKLSILLLSIAKTMSPSKRSPQLEKNLKIKLSASKHSSKYSSSRDCLKQNKVYIKFEAAKIQNGSCRETELSLNAKLIEIV